MCWINGIQKYKCNFILHDILAWTLNTFLCKIRLLVPLQYTFLFYFLIIFEASLRIHNIYYHTIILKLLRLKDS